MLVEDRPGWSRHYSIYTVELGGHPLGVECRACGQMPVWQPRMASGYL
jgi:hypothetical protein